LRSEDASAVLAGLRAFYRAAQENRGMKELVA
jgi:hypothetical protein